MLSTDPSRRPRKIVPHIRCEGARYHVLWWDTFGRHCTKPDCEINHPPTSPEDSDEH